MDYVDRIEKVYRANSNADKAGPMAKYLKNKFEFFGIPAPERKSIERDYISKHGLPDVQQLPEIIEAAYTRPQRELHYFAMVIASKLRKKLPEDFIETARFMIVTNSWWDTVDFIAAWIVGELVKAYPGLVATMDAWIEDENMWLQRTTILYQLKYKNDTDHKRLFNYCRMHAGQKEFFIRKAIGWALREYSKHNAGAVKQFVADTSLTPFSKKEALKWLNRKG